MTEKKEVTINVNGKDYTYSVEPRVLLVHFIRNQCGLTGAHVGCDTTSCGACTILLDGRSVKSCTLFAVQANGHSVTTIEGMGSPEKLHTLQKAFVDEAGLQCGYCTPGMIMQAAWLLKENPNPTEDEIRKGLSGNLCRCTGYQGIVKAVQASAKEMSR